MHAVGGSSGSAAAAAGAAAAPAGVAAVAPTQLPAIDATTLTVEPGEPTPLGASPGQDGQQGVNFALWAPAATSVTLCLHDDQDRPIMETLMQRTGDTWHAFVAGLPQVRAQPSLCGRGWLCQLVGSSGLPCLSEPAMLLSSKPYTPSCPCCPAPQSGVLYGYKVAGNGGWETPYRWDKNKVGWAATKQLVGCSGH